jgi:hypothetical protein
MARKELRTTSARVFSSAGNLILAFHCSIWCLKTDPIFTFIEIPHVTSRLRSHLYRGIIFVLLETKTDRYWVACYIALTFTYLTLYALYTIVYSPPFIQHQSNTCQWRVSQWREGSEGSRHSVDWRSSLLLPSECY